MCDIKVLNNKCKMGGGRWRWSTMFCKRFVISGKSGNKSIDDDDVDLLQLDVQELNC
jgi:hypothetical protein